ncbi:MAG: cofactor-independent phosphoglycerate mutase [bacterium]|nr:cofactor-independent phosphoglycerate mutase [bacterium]
MTVRNKRKHIIILGDGMADEPIAELGDKTPLVAARKPNIDSLAEKGRLGLLKTVPESMPPGSEIANMAVLGYDVRKVYEGRGVLEAASLGVTLEDDDMAMRCNLISIEDGKIKTHSAGHIPNEEAEILVAYLQEHLCDEQVKLYQGVSYRHLLVIKKGNKHVACTPPHDKLGKPYKDHLVHPLKDEGKETAEQLNRMILRSQELLENHPVNVKRKAEGKEPANSIWPWSPGYRPQMKTLKEMLEIEKGAVISAVDLIQGIGVCAGLEVIKVEGATGLYTTNYEGKAEAALKALETNDLVYQHIEAPEEARHEGNAKLKVRTIEDIDEKVVKYLFEETAKMDVPVNIAFLPDHPTPCRLRTHTSNPVPFIIYKPGINGDDVKMYDEQSASCGAYGLVEGNQFINELISEK